MLKRDVATAELYLADMTSADNSKSELNPILKLLLEVGPLAVFFLTFQYGAEVLKNPMLLNGMEMVTGSEALKGSSAPLFVATAFFMVAIAISLTVSWCLTRTLPKMAMVTGIVVAISGGLTLWLQDDTFIKMKPTIVNCIFAAILAFGLMRGQSYLKHLMGDALPLTDLGWMIFTKRWALFFIFLAVLNEIVWRTQTDDIWVNFKTFVNVPLTMAFVGFHWSFLQRHSTEET